MTLALSILAVAAALAVPVAWLLGERHGQRRGGDRAEQRGIRLGRALERGDAALRHLDEHRRTAAMVRANPVTSVPGPGDAPTMVLRRSGYDPAATAEIPALRKGTGR